MYFNFIDILKIITVSQIFLLSGFLIFNSGLNRKRNYLLTAFILSKALFLADTIFIDYKNVFFPFIGSFIVIGSSFQWLIGPTLFFSIIVTTIKDFKLKYIHLLNAVPFLLYMSFVISRFHIYNYGIKYNLLQSGFPYSTPWYRTAACLNYIQFAIYGILALRVLYKVREKALHNSSRSVDNNLFYFRFLIYDFILFWGLNTLGMYVPYGETGHYILWAITILNIFFIANAMVFQGLKFPDLFLAPVNGKQKYEKHPLTDNEKKQYAGKITEFMSGKKPYLNPEFSLSDLAEKTALPTYTLSQVLNLVMKQNFYDFVNKYRIEEFKKIISEEPNGSTILEIVYKCGFNSKSVFNAAFKKYTGTTPREFRKQAHINHPSEQISAN